MRDILFRGKRKDNGEWVYGNLITDGEDVFVLVKENLLKGLDVGGWIDGAQSYDVIPETVGQYTGMTDKNGKKIFEGDIIRVCSLFDEVEVGVVLWSEERAKWLFGYGNSYYPSKRRQVIGNAHDNPELLKSIKEV